MMHIWMQAGSIRPLPWFCLSQPPEERALWQECRPKISKQAFGEDTFHTIHPCACVTPAGLGMLCLAGTRPRVASSGG